MNLIDVKVHYNFLSNNFDKFVAMDPHSMKDLTKESKPEEVEEYSKILQTLKTYRITEVECVSGLRIDAKHINFYLNEPRKAILNEDGTVIITHKKY